MVISHFSASTTSAGFLPKQYKLLESDLLTPALQQLLSEKEDSLYERMVRKKINNGDLPDFQTF
jgi:hypothetical protein